MAEVRIPTRGEVPAYVATPPGDGIALISGYRVGSATCFAGVPERSVWRLRPTGWLRVRGVHIADQGA